MDCNCKDLESSHTNFECKCGVYRQRFPDCQCESESVSDNSPGIVQDEEWLVRSLYNANVLEDGCVTTAYIRGLIGDKGLSVDRLDHSSDIQLRTRELQHPLPQNQVLFVAAQCSKVRDLNIDQKRLFCIYDTASRERPEHAEICQNVDKPTGEGSKKLMMKIAEQLAEVFSEANETPSACIEDFGD